MNYPTHPQPQHRIAAKIAFTLILILLCSLIPDDMIKLLAIGASIALGFLSF